MTTTVNDIIKTERVNKAYLEYIVDNWDGLEFRASVESDESWDPLKICKEYLMRLDSKGEKKTFYRQHDSQGRYFAVKGLSLQSMPREVRHTISKDLYWDIDFENCHPVLLSQYCHKNNIICSALDDYINNRNLRIKLLMFKNPGMDRDGAKKIILSIMNGGKQAFNDIETKPDWISKFYYEMRAVLEAVCAINKDSFEKQKTRRLTAKKDYNIEGSFVNTILCDLENKAVQCLDKYLTQKGYNVDVLVFDGLMIRKDTSTLMTQDILNEASEFIKKKIEYTLRIVEKSMDEGFKLPVDAGLTEYQKWKVGFEKNNCKVMNMTSYLEIDPEDKNIIFRAEDKLLSVHRNVEHVKTWIEDPKIRTYRKLDFLPPPLAQPEDVFNTYSGFQVQKLNDIEFNVDCIKPILTHISYLVNHKTENVEYMLNWLANIMQTPACPTNTAIIIKSVEGVGKNIFFDFIKSILGEEYCIGTSDPENDCFGSFNNLLINKLLINMNETKQEDTAKYIELIKTYITETKIQIKLKNRDTISVNNFIRWIFFTNRDLPFKLPKGQRRFWGVEADGSMANNKEYMTTLLSAIRDKQVQYSFYKFLMGRDISGFDFVNNRPQTAFLADMVSAGSDKVLEFMNHLKESVSDLIVDNKLSMSSNTIYKKYCEFLIEFQEMEKVSSTAFGLSLKKYSFISKARTSNGVQVNINFSQM